ncbi:hypothetical protein NLG97_g10360 [Lecanicillium saksenae]|uniref:Uncharacterized protein n=1 Tax=Lecanicillium saksenae TaxID=468837 RepID=A0ACC1QFE5_9HYPO|nr:hypothetical protein NLG97_g10360 [Lecanicillium saksenae]
MPSQVPRTGALRRSRLPNPPTGHSVPSIPCKSPFQRMRCPAAPPALGSGRWFQRSVAASSHPLYILHIPHILKLTKIARRLFAILDALVQLPAQPSPPSPCAAKVTRRISKTDWRTMRILLLPPQQSAEEIRALEAEATFTVQQVAATAFMLYLSPFAIDMVSRIF